jgi:hypothetical protein
MGGNRQDASDYIEKVAAAVLRVMRKHAQLRFDELLRKVDAIVPTSGPSLRRACTWLRQTHDAPLRYDARMRMWVLERRDFTLPLLDPTADDIVAVAFAGALLSPIGDPDLDRRIQSLLMELDERVASSGGGRKLRSHASAPSGRAALWCTSSHCAPQKRLRSGLAAGARESTLLRSLETRQSTIRMID